MTRRDFRTASNVPLQNIGRCIVVPASQEWLGLLNAALLMLTEPWRYTQVFETDLTPADMAAAWMQIYTASLQSDCEGTNMLLRQNPADPCILETSIDGVTWTPWADLMLCSPEPMPSLNIPDDTRVNDVTDELEVSFDGGTTWTPASPPADPAAQPWTPARVPAAGADDHERRCNAAAAAAQNLQEMYRQTYGAIAAGVVNTWNGLLNFIAELNDALARVVWRDWYTGAVAVMDYFLGTPDPWIDYYDAAELDSTALQSLQCLLFDNVEIAAGVAVFDFGAVRDNVIDALGLNPGTAVWTHLNYLQENGLNRLADFGFGTGLDCFVCINECANYTDNFTSGLGPWSSFDASFASNIWGSGGHGAWNAGGFLRATSNGTGALKEVNLIVTLPDDCTVLSAEMYTRTATSGGTGDNQRITYYNASKVALASSGIGGNNGTDWALFRDVRTVSNVKYIQLSCITQDTYGDMDNVAIETA